MSKDVIIHHADHSETRTQDWYNAVFDADSGADIGDWWWGEETDGTRVLWLVVPIPDDRADHGSYGPLVDGTGELIRIYPSHEGPSDKHPSGNWAAPGPVEGWDGNIEEPTFSPSIYVGGSTDHPGWHGFFEKGKLRTV